MIKKLLFLLLFPSICIAGDLDKEVAYINRVARNPASELRFLKRRTENTEILNPLWGKGWAHTPKFDGKEFQPQVQTKNGNTPEVSSRPKLSWSFRLEHFDRNQDPTLRFGISTYPQP